MGKNKILVVDDQLGIRELLKVALANYNINEAVSGDEALKLIPEWKPELVIIDMKLPGLSGIDTIAKINELGFCPKVILMTAYENIDIDMGEAKISGFLEKPFDLDKLTQMVENLLTR